MNMSAASPPITTTRPEITAAMMAETGLSPDVLRNLVHRFYTRVRADAVLGPIFAARITDWAPHLDRMVAFWGSVVLMTINGGGHPWPGTPIARAVDVNSTAGRDFDATSAILDFFDSLTDAE